MPITTRPNMGLFFDRPPINIPARGLRDGNNFRVKNGTLESRNLGWEKFAAWKLNGPVLLIDNFFPRNLPEQLIFATDRDIYLYDPQTDTVRYLNPVIKYASGVTRTNGSKIVTAAGKTFLTDGVKAGDQVVFSAVAADYHNTTLATAAGWYTVQTVDSQTQLTLTANFTGTTGSSAMTVRTTFTQAAFVEWSTDTFVHDGDSGNDLWIATNGIDPVVSWDAIAPEVTLHDELAFTARYVAVYRNMMIYGNVTQSGDFLPTTIINSDLGRPLKAGATGTGISEQFVVHSGSDPIVNMVPLGDYLIIYAERKLISVQFVGDPLIFLFRVAISGYGPIASKALSDFGDYHEFISSDAAYRFDGVTLKETSSHVWRDILRQADPIRRRQTFSHLDEENGDLIWSVPSTTDPGVGTIGAPAASAWTEHYLEDTGVPTFAGSPHSRRDFPFTATGFYTQSGVLTWADMVQQWGEFNYAWNDQFFQANFPINLSGDASGQIWTFNKTQTADGVVLPSFVRTGTIALRTGRERDLLSRIYPFIGSPLPYLLDVTLYMSDFVSSGMVAKGLQQFDMSLIEGLHFVLFYRRGRAMELQFGSVAGDPWVLTGWDYDTRKGGTR